MNIDKDIWKEFRSTTCAVCGKPKKPNNGFCRSCYFSLPKAMQSAMWQRFGEGYEEAHCAASDWLCNKQAEADL